MKLGAIYKIGMTRNPHDRRQTFNVKLPFQVDYDHLIYAGDMRALEAALHERFKGKLVNGEWFRLSPDDVAFIKSLHANLPPNPSRRAALFLIQFGAGAALAILLWIILLR